jgi:hypothetical protein
MSREQEKDFLEFWDYCREIRDVAVAQCSGPLPLYNQNMVLAYAAITWNARRKAGKAKMKPKGGAK